MFVLQSASGIKDADIARTVGVATRAGGMDHALYDAPRTGQPPKISDTAEAHLVATACSSPPAGRDHWTLELLQKRMII